MKKYLKYLAFLVILSWAVAWADMIEVTDDDRHQYLEFSNCDPDSFVNIIFGVMVNPDSGYAESPHSLIDTIHSETLEYIAPDRDSSGYVIPGHYTGEYWFYVISVRWNGDHVLPLDTTHVMVDYTISVGCGGRFHVD